MRQKVVTAMVLTGWFLLSLTAVNVFSQEPDTLDVPQGYETLNRAIQADTSATGGPKNLNRVYRLERGGYYLLNGILKGIKAAPLRVVAAKGEGPKPMIIPAVTESGSAGNAFQPGGDIEVRGLYVSGIDNLGNQAGKNMFRCDGKKARIIIDDCFLDHDAQTIIRMNAEGQKLLLTNSILRNSILLANPSNGRMIDTRSNTQDSIFIQNCTLYLCSHYPLEGSGIIHNLIFDHNTFYETGGRLRTEKMVHGVITNNLFMDCDFEGSGYDSTLVNADSTRDECVTIDSLKSTVAAETDRVIRIAHNVWGYSPEITAMLNSVANRRTSVLFNLRTQAFIDRFPNMTAENNIVEYPALSDPPDPSVIAAYARHRIITNFSNEGNPDPRADRNGMAALADNPASMGPAPDEFDFDYPSTAAAYTHAEGGFPAGDLNWFPDKKAQWQAWLTTGVTESHAVHAPAIFALQQNYPNPFNPCTTISYQLQAAATVHLAIYNALGQRVTTLIDRKRQAAGAYQVAWNGLNDAGQQASSGLYICRLQAEGQVQTIKMVMMK
ncbi:MAG TPA: FlgD immunoglobulin-like domain containing protein [bacterium]|mgnify:CR=1 FL=1|nr:FlgD immunoglobulin-like domain containing protein [bacterium]